MTDKSIYIKASAYVPPHIRNSCNSLSNIASTTASTSNVIESPEQPEFHLDFNYKH